MITIKEISWVAGILEGEGCFGIHGTSNSPFIDFTTTDEDVIKRIATIWKTNIYTKSKKEPNHKTIYSTRIYSNDAVAWMMTIYSLMGYRRKEKIRELIQVFKDNPRNKRSIVFPCGHPRTIGNTKGTKWKHCLTCHRLYTRRIRNEKKESIA